MVLILLFLLVKLEPQCSNPLAYTSWESKSPDVSWSTYTLDFSDDDYFVRWDPREGRKCFGTYLVEMDTVFLYQDH